MKKIEGVELSSLISRAEEQIKEEQTQKAAGMIKTLLGQYITFKKEEEKLSKDMEKVKEKIDKLQSKITRLKEGDWSILQEANGKEE